MAMNRASFGKLMSNGKNMKATKAVKKKKKASKEEGKNNKEGVLNVRRTQRCDCPCHRRSNDGRRKT
jgi:hypothetical protein